MEKIFPDINANVHAPFTHGQLYIAASRIGDPQHLHFAVNKRARRKNRNVVYKEIP